MAKNTKKKNVEAPQSETTEETTPVTDETSTQEETVEKEEKTDAPKTAIAKAAPSSLAALGEGDVLFLERYGKAVKRVAEELPTTTEFQKITDALPEEFIDNLMGIIKRMMGSRKGVYGDSDRPDFPELRVYHGTGNDPNRPDKQIPGEYYLTSKENVGEKFEGTVLAMWGGRTMWADTAAGETSKMPICQSMDRKIGSTCGECETCPHKPWRDGEQQRCGDDMVAFMLSRDMKEIVLVRFQKTSEPAGRQLKKFTKRSMELWTKWYQLSLQARVSKTDDSKRWFVMQVEPCTGDDALVPESIHAFCDAMCVSLEATFILPNMASIYRDGQADDDDDDTTEDSGGSADLMTKKADEKSENYGDMEDAPNV